MKIKYTLLALEGALEDPPEVLMQAPSRRSTTLCRILGCSQWDQLRGDFAATRLMDYHKVLGALCIYHPPDPTPHNRSHFEGSDRQPMSLATFGFLLLAW